MLKLTLIATLTLLPILAILATILLDELGCHGGTAARQTWAKTRCFA